MSKKIAITGSIGSGKSTVSRLFEIMGIPIYNADNEAKTLLTSPEVIDKIVAITGNGIIDHSGLIIKSELAQVIFNDKEKLNSINKIIHPKVIANYLEWVELNKNKPFTLFESAIIFESNLESNFDAIVDVFCPDEIAIKRASARDGVSEELIKKRLKNQMNSEIKRDKADFVVYNNGKQSVIEQVFSIKSQIEQKC